MILLRETHTLPRGSVNVSLPSFLGNWSWKLVHQEVERGAGVGGRVCSAPLATVLLFRVHFFIFSLAACHSESTWDFLVVVI